MRTRRARGMGAFAPSALGMALALAGCKPSATSPESAPETVVALPSVDLNPDGTIGDRGLQKIGSHSADPNLTVAFIRTDLSDQGLAQLAQYPNIRHVQAIGSHLTDKGIDKLKQTLPQVDVSY